MRPNGYVVRMTDTHGAPVTWTPTSGKVSALDDPQPPLVRAMRRLEEMPLLERFTGPTGMASRPFAGQRVGGALRGDQVGHALHPALAAVTLGSWSSALVLDLFGGRESRPSSELLLATGLVSALPSVATGLAEWRTTGPAEGRIGALHAALNGVGATLFAASLGLRRAGLHRTGVAAALSGAAVASAAGFLGGHLAAARKVGSRAEAFAHDEIGPQLVRPTDTPYD